MYKLSGKLKLFSIILLVIGALGIIYSFVSVPSNEEEAKEIMVAQQPENNAIIDGIQQKGFTQRAMNSIEEVNFLSEEGRVAKALHQLKNRPWASTFTAAFFFFMIALGALVFQAIQYASQAGWSPVLYRVFEGITGYVLPGSIIVALLVVLAGSNFYPWQNADLVAEDEILQVKALYLNKPFFFVRLLIYLGIWNVYRYYQRKNSLEIVDAQTLEPYRQNYTLSVWFLVLFGLSESPMVWDWFMSLTPHWYSALYAWYIFASLFVAGITMITLITIQLKKLGHLEFVNDSHLHDLAKYIFAFSIFWTYIWFSQFMLIWYANIPEEAAHFVLLIQHYKLPFFGMLLINFVFPFLILMNTDFKRIPWLVELTGIIVLVGHYIVIYLAVIPTTMGVYGSFGIPEFAAILFFLGLFIFVVGTELGKVPLEPKGDPYLKESENFEY